MKRALKNIAKAMFGNQVAIFWVRGFRLCFLSEEAEEFADLRFRRA